MGVGGGVRRPSMRNARKVIEVMALEKRSAALIEDPRNYRHIRREFPFSWPSVLDGWLRPRSPKRRTIQPPGWN